MDGKKEKVIMYFNGTCWGLGPRILRNLIFCWLFLIFKIEIEQEINEISVDFFASY